MIKILQKYYFITKKTKIFLLCCLAVASIFGFSFLPSNEAKIEMEINSTAPGIINLWINNTKNKPYNYNIEKGYQRAVFKINENISKYIRIDPLPGQSGAQIEFCNITITSNCTNKILFKNLNWTIVGGVLSILPSNNVRIESMGHVILESRETIKIKDFNLFNQVSQICKNLCHPSSLPLFLYTSFMICAPLFFQIKLLKFIKIHFFGVFILVINANILQKTIPWIPNKVNDAVSHASFYGLSVSKSQILFSILFFSICGSGLILRVIKTTKK